MNFTPILRIVRQLRITNKQINIKKFHSVTLAQEHDQRMQNNCFLASNFPNYKRNDISFVIRHYAKGKDKKKEKGKSKVVIDENQMAEVVNVESIKKQMDNALTQMKENFTKFLSIRSSAGSIESLVVTLDGQEHVLQELAQISRKNPKTVILNMSTFPQAIPEVLKSIQKSGLNLNPQQDGTTIFIPIPKVTMEHRESLAKNAKQYFIKCRDSIKDIQNKTTKSLKRKDGISEDLVRSVENQLKALADKYITEGERILESKQKDILGD
ncbi:ribosome-recycling factor, mitochondrial [Coccinella septempunctata]|uniref:ribosome-recycling factor, mitochondrial n=1 Tax=Coccinella septempunctata TaxID=41139 RepID=UPI001D0743A5|nr:ribosome-recycling factor, mitochondrial [Coccinella septempunctata]